MISINTVRLLGWWSVLFFVFGIFVAGCCELSPAQLVGSDGREVVIEQPEIMGGLIRDRIEQKIERLDKANREAEAKARLFEGRIAELVESVKQSRAEVARSNRTVINLRDFLQDAREDRAKIRKENGTLKERVGRLINREPVLMKRLFWATVFACASAVIAVLTAGWVWVKIKSIAG